MKTYIIQYRRDGGAWSLGFKVQARTLAGAIIQAAHGMKDIDGGSLEISACLE